MNKEKKQSWIKKLYTSPNHRIFSIFATVILFIMIFMGCICYELLQNREAVIQAYEADQEDYLQLLAYNIQSVQKSGKDAEVLAFLQEKTVSAGERFFVYTRGSEVRWTVGQEECTISVVSDMDSILERTSTIKHGYYIVIATGLVSVVLLSLLIALLESWNKAEKNLKGTKKELDKRNRKLEYLCAESI